MMWNGLVDGSKGIDQIGELMIVIYNRGVSFAECSKLIVNMHRSGARLSGEHPLQSGPDIARSGAFNYISQDVFG